MLKLPVVKTKELIRVVEKLGFQKFHQVGSHAQFKNAEGRRITISVHLGQDIGRKTLRGIINDLGLTVEEFMKILKD